MAGRGEPLFSDAGVEYASPNGDRRQFDRFMESNVQRQRQRGFSTVEVKVVRGDLTAEQLRGLGEIMRRYSGGFARTTVHQNLVLRVVRDESVYEVWQELLALGLGEAGADEISDGVSCPGTDSCKLGITSSMGLNGAIQERIAQMDIDDPLTRRIHIKISGCPNGCGQHHVADIGFYGASIKVGDKAVPAYIAHLGGSMQAARCATASGSRPASPPSGCLRRSSAGYASTSQTVRMAELFPAFVDRVGVSEFEGRVKDLTMPIECDLENMNYFIDYNREAPFQVIRGEGECAVCSTTVPEWRARPPRRCSRTASSTSIRG